MPLSTKPKTPKVPKAPKTEPVGSTTPVPANSTPLAPVSSVDFRASDYFPSDWFQPSDHVPVLDESTYNQRLERIKGQQRAVEVLQQNLVLGRQLLKAEGYAIDCKIETVNNQIKTQDLSTIGVKLQQAGVKTQIEQAKLTEMGHDLNGQTTQASLKEQTWQLKLDGLRIGIEEARLKLAEQRQSLQTQYPSYQLPAAG